MRKRTSLQFMRDKSKNNKKDKHNIRNKSMDISIESKNLKGKTWL